MTISYNSKDHMQYSFEKWTNYESLLKNLPGVIVDISWNRKSFNVIGCLNLPFFVSSCLNRRWMILKRRSYCRVCTRKSQLICPVWLLVTTLVKWCKKLPGYLLLGIYKMYFVPVYELLHIQCLVLKFLVDQHRLRADKMTIQWRKLSNI